MGSLREQLARPAYPSGWGDLCAAVDLTLKDQIRARQTVKRSLRELTARSADPELDRIAELEAELADVEEGLSEYVRLPP